MRFEESVRDSFHHVPRPSAPFACILLVLSGSGLLANSNASSNEAEEPKSLNNLGLVAMSHGQLAEAESRFRECLTVLEHAGSAQSAMGGIVLSNLGLVLQKQRKFEAARAVYASAVDVITANSGQHSAEYAKLMLGIALLSFRTGNYNDAIEKNKIVVELDNTRPILTKRERAEADNNLGLSLATVGRFSEAEPLLTKTVRLYKSDGSGSGTEAMEALTNLSTLQMKMGALAAAEQSEREALAMAANAGGKENSAVANIHNSLGVLAMCRNNFDNANTEFQTALAIWERSAGASSPEYAATLSNLATLADHAGKRKRAEDLYRKSLAIDEAQLGPNHPRVASDLANIAAELVHSKHIDEALSLYERAEGIDEQCFGPATEEVAAMWRNIGITQFAAKRLEGARTAYAKAAIAYNATPSPDMRAFSSCMREYANLLRILHRFAEAEEADLVGTRLQVKDAIRMEKNAAAPTSTALSFR